MKTISKIKFLVKLSLSFLGFGLLIASFQNCSGSSFSTIDASSEATLYSQSSVFGANSGTIPLNGSDSSNGNNLPVAGGTSGSTGSTSNSGGSVPLDSTPIPLSYVCSDMASNRIGNLVTATSLEVILGRQFSTEKFCTFKDTSLKAKIMQKKSLSLEAISAGIQANCPGLADGTYQLTINNPDFTAKGVVVTYSESFKALFPSFMNTSDTLLDPQTITVRNKVAGRTNSAIVQFLYDHNLEKHDDPATPCDAVNSPLMIQMNSDVENPEPLVLTSQANGIYFDILGERSDPVPHTPLRISWHRSKQYLFITLPNEKGEVNGINEMFGNNTRGPDGEFASDGFAALAKYDGLSADAKTRVAPADGYINEADPIYSKIRLWRDSGFDGRAQRRDLITLKEAGITTIDLKYDPHYREVDKYGNEVRYKSAAKSKNGKLHLVFDVWFKSLPQ